MEIDSFAERLASFMKAKGLNDNQLTDIAGLSNGLVGKVKKGSSKLSLTSIAKVLNAFPDLSSNWLLTGRGEMLICPDHSAQIDHDSDDVETRPRIPLDAAAGFLSLISQSVCEDECERFPVVSRLPKYDFTIVIKGDSMEPEFHSGDEVACRLIDRPSFIQWGRPHILDTIQGIVLKRIYNRSNTILCRSDNPSYEDFEIPKEDILHIAIVVGSVRLY